jgi:hypothetical protein
MFQKIYKIKSLFSLIIILGLLNTSCEKGIYDGNEFKVYEQEEPEGPVLPKIPKIGKKGICLTTKGDTWSRRVSETKPHWHYSWGLTPNFKEPDNLDFVPMFWGRWFDDEQIQYLKELKEKKKIKYILGFNEPDGEKQANMTVDEAIEKWPKLEEIGLPLVSPAPANWGTKPDGWLEQFMVKAKEKNYRVDYIGIHLYYGTNVQQYLDILETVYKKYNKPIWITEMAVADWNKPVDEIRYSRAQVLEFMKKLLPKLEELPYVYRYAWYSGGHNATSVGTSSLFDDNEQLNELGKYYASFKPNDLIGPGKDNMVDPDKPVVDPNDLIKNGHFETGKLDPWKGYNNYVKSKGLFKTFNGLYSGAIKNGGGSLLYFADLEPGATYEVTFQAKWAASAPAFKFAVKEQTGGKKKYFMQEIKANANTWTLNKATFKASSESKVRLIWYKAKGPEFYLDAVTCIKK